MIRVVLEHEVDPALPYHRVSPDTLGGPVSGQQLPGNRAGSELRGGSLQYHPPRQVPGGEAVRSPAEALNRARHRAGQDEDLASVMDETERLTTLVEQLLELSRAERSAEVEEVDLVELATDRVDTWSAAAGEREVNVALGASVGGAVVAVTHGAVEQILDNLIDNAVAVAPPGSTVTVSIERNADSHVVAVSDSGPGLSDNDKQRATDRFWRGDEGRAGTGLGLAIVRSLAEAHGGRVLLLDAEGGGLKVEVTFPAVA